MLTLFVSKRISGRQSFGFWAFSRCPAINPLGKQLLFFWRQLLLARRHLPGGHSLIEQAGFVIARNKSST